ncbi:small multidrug resistance protein [Fictibacillus macauensis ZFHKF-1]|uniref:Small multidrug resistance protein n=1 Tax=Fictibacillus macauensis ZFHKF-1 TaxID=1196324 RepID=I8IX99_9BACL|nr:multidrug efflux SMR transporter [Fictibacillus macauensis]EIT84106.1 small multidrug resistance protein [Fictibacillus macauensis ZFHKF-1]
MGWLFVLLAGSCEVIGVIGLNKVSQKKNIKNFLLMEAGFLSSFALLSLAMQTLSMGTAYAVWTGIGTVGSIVMGMLFFGESRDRKRLFFISLVVFATIGLKVIS